MVVYSLRPHMTLSSFGYETTQAFRQNVLNSLKIDNKLVVSTPYSGLYWQEQLRKLGFEPNNVVIVPHLYSDVKPYGHGFTREEFEAWIDQKGIEVERVKGDTYVTETGYLDLILSPEGYVILVTERSKDLKVESTLTVFEKPFFKTFAGGSFEYYNTAGQVVLSGVLSGKNSFDYTLDGEVLSELDLLSRFVKEHVTPKDLVIIDQNYRFPASFQEECQKQNIVARRVLHYNHFHGIDKEGGDLHRKHLDSDMFVASPYIIPRLKRDLDVNGVFLPPIGVRVRDTLPVGLKNNKVLLTGHSLALKRIHWAVEAFRQMPHLELDIYGLGEGEYKLKEELSDEEKIIPENVHFKGFVPSLSIPRSQYCAYLSCSETEMFANAMVESLAYGLIPILSQVDYGHNQALEELGLWEEFGFDSVERLVDCLQRLGDMEFSQREDLSAKVLQYASKFSFESTRRQYAMALAQTIDHQYLPFNPAIFSLYR